jgi:hypothetical protein
MSDAAGEIRPPWVEHPYRLISWLDMEKFSADGFFRLSELLSIMRMVFADTKDAIVGDESPDYLRRQLKHVEKECRKIGLIQSAKAADRLQASIAADSTGATLASKTHDLSQLIHSEMEEELFFYVPRQLAEFYTQSKPLFGSSVFDAFPSAQREIQEAGKCLALARPTACVFRLMRVLEAALGIIEADLSLNPGNGTWNSYINGIMPMAKKKYPDQQGTHKDWRAFYFGIEAQLIGIKNKWRDETTHNIAQVYSEEEAQDLVNLIAGFMRHLATKLKES